MGGGASFTAPRMTGRGGQIVRGRNGLKPTLKMGLRAFLRPPPNKMEDEDPPEPL